VQTMALLGVEISTRGPKSQRTKNLKAQNKGQATHMDPTFVSHFYMDYYFLHLHMFFCHPYKHMKNTFFILLVPSHILDYIIRKLISDLEIAYGLCNPKYNFKKWYFGLYSLEIWILRVASGLCNIDTHLKKGFWIT